ncbi:MAG: SDR family NAD(P)-dependent oxidoreductase [Thermodesulfobacteriota bacterium]
MGGIADLAGKVAVVTGGASGIGWGIAKRLAEQGAHVVIGDVEEAALERAAGELGALGVRTDVRDAASVRALADEAVKRFGTVHVIVNNAGVGPFGRIADLTEADWRWIIEVNLWGVIHGVTTFLPILQANPDGGHIVNTSSMAGLRPRPGLGAYAVTKYGIVALSETLALELAEDGSKVGVTVFLPGPFRTNIGTSTRNRPAELRGALADGQLPAAAEDFQQPERAGDIVVAAIRTGALYAVSHPDMFDAVQARHERLADAFRAANGFQSQFSVRV